jgi:hypothetical protein
MFFVVISDQATIQTALGSTGWARFNACWAAACAGMTFIFWGAKKLAARCARQPLIR